MDNGNFGKETEHGSQKYICFGAQNVTHSECWIFFFLNFRFQTFKLCDVYPYFMRGSIDDSTSPCSARPASHLRQFVKHDDQGMVEAETEQEKKSC